MIVVDKNKCASCEVCTTVCPTGAVQIDEVDGKAIIKNELCIECKSCIEACPQEAISERFDNKN